MMFKLALAFFITWLSSRPTPDKTAISVVTFLFMLILFVYTYYVSPFVDPMNDFMDACGRFTAIVTSFAAVLTVNAADDSKLNAALGTIVLLFGVLNMGIMLCVCMSEYEFFRHFYQNCLKLGTPGATKVQPNCNFFATFCIPGPKWARSRPGV